jgi:Na+-translocating ferredoxin:NAD+ oxidoreductase RnfC subunit
MLSDFDMFSGFISCKLSIRMFSRVSWVKKTRKKWNEMQRMSVLERIKAVGIVTVGCSIREACFSSL